MLDYVLGIRDTVYLFIKDKNVYTDASKHYLFQS